MTVFKLIILVVPVLVLHHAIEYSVQVKLACARICKIRDLALFDCNLAYIRTYVFKLKVRDLQWLVAH